jgi:vacuolar protein sorting-associated protein 13A/C
LKNLSVKRDAINRLVALPVRVNQGSVGRIELTIPWTQLASQPTVVRLSDVFVLAEPSPAYSEPVSAEESKRKRLAVLDETERASLIAGATNSHGDSAAPTNDLDNSASTFTQRTIAAIISNLQVFVDTVHVRYEDAITNPSEPFAVGLTLDHFAMQACNFVGEPVVANVLADVIYKAVQLRSFAVYWNPKEPALKFATLAELGAQLRATMPTVDKPVTANSYLLQPVSALVQVSMKKSDVPDMTAAKFSVAFDFEELQLVLNDAQFRDMLRVVSFASAWAKKAPYAKLWKRVMAADGLSTARRRWAFGTAAVMQDVHTRRERFNWVWIKAFGRKRRAFLAFHTLWLEEVPPKSDAYRELERVHGTTMDKLIDELPYDDIVFLRALATMQFKRSGALARWRARTQKQVATAAAAAAAATTTAAASTTGEKQSSGGSFFSKMFSKKEKAPATPEKATAAPAAAAASAPANAGGVHMNEQEWKELTDTFGLLDQKSSTQRVSNAPRDYVFARALGKVRGGGARLEALQRDGSKQPVAMVKWSDFRLNVAVRPTSLSVSGSLGSLVAVDCVTVDPVFPNMIDRLVVQRGSSAPSDIALPPPPLLSFAIDQHPLDKKNVDLFVKADMQPLLVVYNFVAIDRIVKFFDSPGASFEDIDALREQSASATRLSMMRRETEQRFLLAIEQQSTHRRRHRHVVAPRIVAPLAVSRASLATTPFVAAVFDLGHLRFKSRANNGHQGALDADHWHRGAKGRGAQRVLRLVRRHRRRAQLRHLVELRDAGSTRRSSSRSRCRRRSPCARSAVARC